MRQLPAYLLFVSMTWSFTHPLIGQNHLLQQLSHQEDSLLQDLAILTEPEEICRKYIELSFLYANSDQVKSLGYANEADCILGGEYYPDLSLRVYKVKANNLRELARRDDAIAAHEKLIELCRKDSNDINLGWAYWSLGGVYYQSANYQDAEKYYLLTVETGKKSEYPRNIARGYRGLAINAYANQDLQEAIRYSQEGLEILENPDLELSVCEACVFRHNLGVFLMEAKNHEQSLAYYYDNLTAYREYDDLLGICKTYNGIGIVFADLAGEKLPEFSPEIMPNDSAEKYFRLCIHLADTLKQGRLKYGASLNYLPVALRKGLSDSSYHDYLRLADEAFDFFSRGKEMSSIVNIENIRGICYKMLGDYQTAEKHIRNGIKIAEENQLVHQYPDIYENLAEVMHLRGNFEQAYDQLLRARELKDSTSLVETREKINQLQLKFETEKKETELTRLTFENLKNSLQAQRQRDLNQMLMLAMVAMLGLFSLIYYFLQKGRKREKIMARQELQLQQQKMDDLLSRKASDALDAMLEGQEKERLRIARELHDGLGSTMAMAQLQIQEIHEYEDHPPERSAAIRKAMELTSSAVKEIRKISHDMASGTVSEYGLAPALLELKYTLESVSDIQFNLKTYRLNEHLSDKVELQLYRIIQELVNNTLKHARASEIQVNITRRPDGISLLYEDDGSGMDKDKVGTGEGLGWKNIETRLLKLSGTMHIDTSPGKGLIVNIEIPISQTPTL